MIRRLRHRIFGHGQDGHTFVGYLERDVYLLCRCRQTLRFRLKNFFVFEQIATNEVRARKAGELHRHGTT